MLRVRYCVPVGSKLFGGTTCQNVPCTSRFRCLLVSPFLWQRDLWSCHQICIPFSAVAVELPDWPKIDAQPLAVPSQDDYDDVGNDPSACFWVTHLVERDGKEPFVVSVVAACLPVDSWCGDLRVLFHVLVVRSWVAESSPAVALLTCFRERHFVEQYGAAVGQQEMSRDRLVVPGIQAGEAPGPVFRKLRTDPPLEQQ